MPANTLLGQYPATGGATGTIPGIPNPVSTAGDAITGNIGNLGALYGLMTQLTGQGAQTALQPLLANLPNYAAMTQQSSQNILSKLRGEVSPSTLNALTEGAAARGIGGGFGPRSPNTSASFLKALGLTSEEMQALGETELTGAVGRTPVPPPINPLNWLPTAEQQQAAATGQAMASAAPDPRLQQAALNNAIQSGLAAGMGGVRAPGGAGGVGIDLPSGGGTGAVVGGTATPGAGFSLSPTGPGYRFPTGAVPGQPAPSNQNYQQQQFEGFRQQGYSDEEIAQMLDLTPEEVQAMQGQMEGSATTGTTNTGSDNYYDEGYGEGG